MVRQASRRWEIPGHENEGRHIMQWRASEEGPGRDVFVSIMGRYRPNAHVEKPRRRTPKLNMTPVTDLEGKDATLKDVRYHDLNRPVRIGEVLLVRSAAEVAGLWRFSNSPKHGNWAS